MGSLRTRGYIVDELCSLSGNGPVAVATLLKTKDDNIWKQAEFQVYDIPNDTRIYRLRHQQLQNITNLPLRIKLLEQVECQSRDHLTEFAKKRDDELGVILRHPEGLYQPGRSDSVCVHRVRSACYV